jgi:hypothetical protein
MPPRQRHTASIRAIVQEYAGPNVASKIKGRRKRQFQQSQAGE